MEANMDRGMTESKSDSMQNEMDSLKESFTKLRSDVAELFSHALGFGRSGAFMARDYGTDAMENVKSRFNDLKSRGTEQMHAVENHVGAHPMKDVLIAFGAGFILAKLMHHK